MSASPVKTLQMVHEVLSMAGKDCKPAFELQSNGGTKLLIIMLYDVRNSTLQSTKAPFRLKQQSQVQEG